MLAVIGSAVAGRQQKDFYKVLLGGKSDEDQVSRFLSLSMWKIVKKTTQSLNGIKSWSNSKVDQTFTVAFF